jgi:hypothetical protein
MEMSCEQTTRSTRGRREHGEQGGDDPDRDDTEGGDRRQGRSQDLSSLGQDKPIILILRLQ